MNFNTSKFIANVRKIHLTTIQERRAYNLIPGGKVLTRLENFIDYGDNQHISEALDKTCDNFVGNTMFRVLLSKLPPGQKIKITNIGPSQTRQLINQKGSSYSHRTHKVKINLNVYNNFCIGIPERQYYCVDKDEVDIKHKSIAESLFHEFTHCLHHIEDAVRYDLYRKSKLPDDNPWGDKEERRTISGYIEADT
ncbi:MAG: hypothetical protein LBF70_00980 [Holosporales bacterium]|jgi:hypothetical protein|nr:hypothetical protein [Holosporales bacterium]